MHAAVQKILTLFQRVMMEDPILDSLMCKKFRLGVMVIFINTPLFSISYDQAVFSEHVRDSNAFRGCVDLCAEEDRRTAR